jgi:hypothetical protein
MFYFMWQYCSSKKNAVKQGIRKILCSSKFCKQIFVWGCYRYIIGQLQFLLFVASAMLSHGSFSLQSGSH